MVANGTRSVWNIPLLLLMSAFWGATFIAIKIAAPYVGPLTTAASRIAIGAVALALPIGIKRLVGDLSGADWGRLFAAGAFNNAVPFALISWAEQSIDSAEAAILMALAPFFALVFAHFGTNDDKMTVPKLLGALIGFGGILVLFGDAAGIGASESGDGLFQQIAVAGAAASYTISAVLTDRLKGRVESHRLAALVLVSGAVLVVPVALAMEGPQLHSVPPADALVALLYLGLFGTAAAQMIRFQLLKNTGPTFVALSGYLVPLFGILWSILLLGEEIQPFFWLGLALVLGGTALVRLQRPALRVRREHNDVSAAAPQPTSSSVSTTATSAGPHGIGA